MNLELQICTLGEEGLKRAGQMKLPVLGNVSYTVCVQNPGSASYTVPESLIRPDIRVLTHDSRGLSINRNFGLDHAVGDIILIADDDLSYEPSALANVISAFEKNPELDFATFQYTGPANKQYPSFEFSLNEKWPRGYYVTSFEIAIRRSSLPAEARFSPHLGAGTAMFGAGEESVFLINLISHGLKGRFFPMTIATHPTLTTGTKRPEPPLLRSIGAFLWIRFGFFSGFPRLVKDSIRRRGNKFANLKYMLSGFIKAPRYFRRDGSDRQTKP